MRIKKKDKPIEEEQPPAREKTIPELLAAMIFSPTTAFEEILERKMLTVGILITAVMGLLESVTILVGYYNGKGSSLFQLASGNPACAVGLLLVVSWITWKLAQSMQGEGSYLDTLMVIGWSNAIVCITILLGLSSLTARFGSIIWIWAFVVLIIGIQRAHRFSVWRAIGAYLPAIFTIALLPIMVDKYYLEKTYHGVASEYPSFAAYFIPSSVVSSFLAAAALVIVAWMIPRLPDAKRLQALLVAFACIGVAAAITLIAYVQSVDPINEVVIGVRAYHREKPDPARAAVHFERELKYFPSDIYVQLYLAHSLAASGNYKLSVKQYKHIAELVKNDKTSQSITSTGIGTVRYFEGDYKAARKEFKKAKKFEKRYAEPKARLGLAYLRLSNEKEAIKTAKSAISDGHEGYIPLIVLAQAYTITGDVKKAQDAIKKVGKIDKQLASRIAAGTGGWSRAIERLTPIDLRMPLKLPTISTSRKQAGK